MKNIKYDISMIHSEGDKNFFCEMLPYVSEKIYSFKRIENVVTVEFNYEEYRQEIFDKVEILKELTLEKSIQGVEEIECKMLFDKEGVKPRYKEPIFDYLKQTKNIFQVSNGLFAYGGLLLKIMEYFKLKVKELGVKKLKAKELQFPILFPVDSFRKGGYMETFPHHIMFQTTVKSDIEVLNKYAKDEKAKVRILEDHMCIPQNVIKHAACGPIYPSIENMQIDDESLPLAFFIMDKCFRNESSNVFELARLNEFSMAEIVFVGSAEQTREEIKKAMRLWYYWSDVFELNCSIKTANDSFFAGNYKKLKLFQLLGDSKQEFRWLLPYCNTYISCSSVNFHRTHFARKYNIKNKESYCQTACIAFGIERLAYAFLAQHGCNPKNWSSKVYKEIKEYIDLNDIDT